MTPDSEDQDLKLLWRMQKAEPASISLTEIRDRAEAFERHMRRRDQASYAASAVAMAVFAWYVWALPGWLVKLGSGVEVVAIAYVAWQRHQRGSPLEPPAGASAQTLLEFHRSALIRRRDRRRTVWRWYLGPLLPGAALFMLGRWLQSPVPSWPGVYDHRVIAFTVIIIVLAFVIAGQQAALGAGKLQRQIDDLDAFREGD